MNQNLRIPFLIDFDGVINLYGKPTKYSSEFLNFLEEIKLPAFILSNSTLRTRKDIEEFLLSNHMPNRIPIMTAVDAALDYVSKNYQRVSVYCIDKVKKEFEKYNDDENPQAVVIGDMIEGWSIEILNEIFRKVHHGADIVAMHMNRYRSPEENKLTLDAGSFISAIEYATQKKVKLIGKPSAVYFQAALEMLGYPKESPFLMLGDDIELDIIPAQKLGNKAILILTGKTNLPLPTSVSPNFVAKDLSEVIEILKNFYSLT